MDKAALLQAIKEAEAKAAKDSEEAQAQKVGAIAAAHTESERVRREGLAAVDGQAAAQMGDARRRIDADKGEKLAAGRVRIRKKRELAEANVPHVADFLVEEFERAARAGFR